MSAAELDQELEAEIEAELARIESDRRRRKVQDRSSLRSTFYILGIAVIVTLGEAFCCWLLWSGFWPTWTAWAGHALTTAAAGAAAWFLHPNGVRSRFLALLAMTTMFLGPFGPLGTMMAMALHGWFRRSATPFDEWYESLFPEEVDEPSRRLYEMLTRGLAQSASQETVTSFTDVLQYGSIEQKRAVISLLSRDFRPEFAPALQSALSDPNPAVRVQAATAAANIEGDFLDTAIELENRAKAHPQDAEAQFEVARHFDNYAFSGILDGDRQNENRRKAEVFYKLALELDDTLSTAALGIGRLMVRQQRLQEAESWFEAGFQLGRHSVSEINWYMEAAYKLGHYDKLRQAVFGFGEEILEAKGASERLKDVVRVWSGHKPPDMAERQDLRLA